MRTADGYLVRKCLSGDSAAFGLLVAKYKEAIYGLACSKLLNFHDAEDVTQEVFLKAYENLHTLKRWDSFHVWLYAITSNLCKMWIRSRSRRPDREFLEDQSPSILATSSTDSYRDTQMLESLREALGSLPEMHRQVLTLHYLSGMTGKEIAEFLGMSPSAVWKRLSRAREQLREEVLAMMTRTFERQGLPGGFTLRIVEALKRIKIQPAPRTPGLPWGLALATGAIIAILSLGSHLNLSRFMNPPMDSTRSGEMAVAEAGEIPVDMVRISRIPTISSSQGDSYGGSAMLPNQQKAVPMAPRGEGDVFPEKATARLGKGIRNQLAYSPDGKLLAAAGAGGIRLLDARTLNESGIFAGHTGAALSVAFSPNGKLLASGSAGAKVHLWNVAEKKYVESLSLQGNAGAVEAVVFSPDGKTLVAKSGGAAYLWDVEKRDQVGVLQGDAPWLYCLAFSPDSRLLALGGVDRAVSLWDVNGQEQIGILPGHTTAVWDVKKQKQIGISQGHMTPIYSIAFSPDGRLLASASSETPVRLWDVEAQKQVGTLGTIVEMKYALLVAFSPDGKTLASSSSKDGTIHLWDVEEQKQVGRLKGRDACYNSIVLNPDGRTLASAAMDGAIRLWDTEAQKQLHSLEYGGAVYSLAFSPDGRTLASGGDDRMVRLWDVDQQKEIVALEGHTGRVRPVAFSPDGKLLASGGRDKPWTIRLWDAEAQEQIGLLQGHKSVVWGVAFSPDGELLASGSLDGTVRLWSVQRRELAGELRHPQGARVKAIAFSPDGKLLASGCWDDIVYIWDVEKRKQVGMLQGHTDDVYSVAFNPDGKLLAAGSANGVVRLWDVENQKQVALLQGHKREVMCVAFSPDGRLLASVCADPEVSVWDVSEQKRVALLKGHSDRGKTVAFSPDGKWLASGSADGTILLWEVNLPVPGRSVEPMGSNQGHEETRIAGEGSI